MKDPQFAKFIVIVNSLVPLALLISDGFNNNLGANPIEYAIRTTGTLTLVFLTLTLTITPLRKITGWNWLSHFRRILGLYAFFYAVCHFLIYFGCYQSFHFTAVIKDTAKRPFILFGMTAFLMLTPLAITSTNAMIKRLGALRWKRLHWLIYPAAIAGVTHYWMLVKADTTKPKAFALAIGILLAYRIIKRFSPPRTRPAT